MEGAAVVCAQHLVEQALVDLRMLATLLGTFQACDFTHLLVVHHLLASAITSNLLLVLLQHQPQHHGAYRSRHPPQGTSLLLLCSLPKVKRRVAMVKISVAKVPKELQTVELVLVDLRTWATLSGQCPA